MNHQSTEKLRQQANLNGNRTYQLEIKINQPGDEMILERAQNHVLEQEYIIRPAEMKDLEQTVELFDL